MLPFASRFLALTLVVCFTSAAFADSPDLSTTLVRGPVAERVDRYLQWSESFGFSGVALLAMKGEIILHKPFGLADRNQGVPNRLDTVFSFGSITKQFTAAAIMKLEQQGKLNSQDPISKYLDDVPPDKQPITIHHLLTHTAGLIDYYGVHDFQKMDRDAAVRGILGTRLLSKPGTEFAYSNPGYTLAAAIVEQVSGRPFAQFMQDEIFLPARMTETGFMGDDLWDHDRCARIYRGARDNGAPHEKPGPYWVLLGNGGVVSTVGQMYLWDRALRTDQVLTSDTRKKLFTPFLNDYAYGWDVLRTDRGTTIHSHNGGSSLGLSAEFQRYVEEDGAFILASNASIGNALAIDYLVDPLSNLIFAPGPDLPPPPHTETEPRHTADYLGRYELPGGGHFAVFEDAGQPFFAPVGQDALSAIDARAAPHHAQAVALNEQTKGIVDAVYANEWDPLIASFTTTGEASVNRARRWTQMLAEPIRRLGNFKSTEVLGTTNLGTETDVELVTWFRVHFDRGSRVWRFHWNDKKIRGLGGDAWPYPFYGPLRFTPDGDGVAFHFQSSTPVEMQFATDPRGAPTALTIPADPQPLHAQKSPADD